MGPSTASPLYFLIMVASLALSLVLFLVGWATTALVMACVGVGLFALHRIAVWGARRRRGARATPDTAKARREMPARVVSCVSFMLRILARAWLQRWGRF